MAQNDALQRCAESGEDNSAQTFQFYLDDESNNWICDLFSALETADETLNLKTHGSVFKYQVAAN